MATQKGRNWSSGDIVTAANLSSIERGVSTLAENYTPTTWSNGDTVTAAALNNIEQGIANAGDDSSDFSTALVKFINNSSNESRVYITTAIAVDADPPFLPNARSEGGFPIYGGDEFEYTIILYKGRNFCMFTDATSASGTGAIEKINSSEAVITGDCTITVSGSSSGQVA